MTDISVHFQKVNNETARIVRKSNTRWIYIVDPPTENQFPNKKVVARVYDKLEPQYRGNGAKGAENWWNKHQQDVKSFANYAHAIIVCNEPGFNPAELDYQKRWIEICNSRFSSLKTVAFNWGVGNPTKYAANEPKIKDIARIANYLGFHEYWVPEFFDNPNDQYTWTHKWIITRYKIFMNSLPKNLWKPILITECGAEGDLNRFVRGKERKHPCGWKELYHGSAKHYISHIREYSTEVKNDVEAAFLFTAGPYDDWTGYNIESRVAREVVVGKDTTPPPKPVPDNIEKRLAANEAAVEKMRVRIENLEKTKEEATNILSTLYEKLEN